MGDIEIKHCKSGLGQGMMIFKWEFYICFTFYQAYSPHKPLFQSPKPIIPSFHYSIIPSAEQSGAKFHLMKVKNWSGDCQWYLNLFHATGTVIKTNNPNKIWISSFQLEKISLWSNTYVTPKMSGSRFRVQARPGVTRLKHIKTHARSLNLSLYNWAVQSQVWARGSKVIIYLYS